MIGRESWVPKRWVRLGESERWVCLDSRESASSGFQSENGEIGNWEERERERERDGNEGERVFICF